MHDSLSGDKTKHTMKEISAMKNDILMLNMEESEKSEVQNLLKDSLGIVARFRRSRKVEIQLNELLLGRPLLLRNNLPI